MPNETLKLPVIQNWSCHNCGGCCREHLIEIDEEEKRRIEKQGWSASDGISMDRPVIQKIGNGRYRLSHTDAGACVFLDENGLCRIHAKFGEPAKPLACRVYPYAVHPAGSRLTVSLRFSCPSVVQNLGTPVSEQHEELKTIARNITKGKHKQFSAPAIHGNEQLDWSDFLKFISAIDDSLADDSVLFVVRLMRVLSWLELVEQSQFESVRGTKLDDYLSLITTASVKAQPDNDLPVLKPSRTGKTLFRQMVAQYARHDTEVVVRGGFKSRFNLLLTGIRFSMGWGNVPELDEPASVAKAFPVEQSRAALCRVRFSDMEQEFDCRQSSIDELFERYFRVKLDGLHFCGPGHFESSLVDGFRSLALMYPIVLWLAKLRAVQQGRDTVGLVDAQAALATADHNFGYSPVLGMRSSLNRIRILGQMQQITRLCGWYTR